MLIESLVLCIQTYTYVHTYSHSYIMLEFMHSMQSDSSVSSFSMIMLCAVLCVVLWCCVWLQTDYDVELCALFKGVDGGALATKLYLYPLLMEVRTMPYNAV